MIHFFKNLFNKSVKDFNKQNNSNMKYLIVGLGNIGHEYNNTRHNIGFMILDQLSSSANSCFEDKRYGSISKFRLKNCELILLKPSTYMNLSGNAVRYWLKKENILMDNMLIICDDISLSLGKLRIRTSGSDGGHNGLKHISAVLGTQQFNRLRFGIGNNYNPGEQVNYVLGKFFDQELLTIRPSIETAVEAVKSFCLRGIVATMNDFNKKKTE